LIFAHAKHFAHAQVAINDAAVAREHQANRGQIKGEVDYQKIARDVFLATDARRAMEQAGLVAPASNTKIITVMGKVFDSSKPKEYLDSFAIKKV
jgi:hypothetical protein